MKVYVVTYGWLSGLYGTDRYATPRVFYNEPDAIAFQDSWRGNRAGFEDTTPFAHYHEIEVE